MSDTNTDDLAQATGLAIALLGSLLEGARVIPKGEFSRHMTNLAIVTHETAPGQGDVLDQWAAMVAQISRARPN